MSVTLVTKERLFTWTSWGNRDTWRSRGPARSAGGNNPITALGVYRGPVGDWCWPWQIPTLFSIYRWPQWMKSMVQWSLRARSQVFCYTCISSPPPNIPLSVHHSSIHSFVHPSDLLICPVYPSVSRPSIHHSINQPTHPSTHWLSLDAEILLVHANFITAVYKWTNNDK